MLGKIDGILFAGSQRCDQILFLDWLSKIEKSNIIVS